MKIFEKGQDGKERKKICERGGETQEVIEESEGVAKEIGVITEGIMALLVVIVRECGGFECGGMRARCAEMDGVTIESAESEGCAWNPQEKQEDGKGT